jgi:hypothetical protein
MYKKTRVVRIVRFIFPMLCLMNVTHIIIPCFSKPQSTIIKFVSLFICVLSSAAVGQLQSQREYKQQQQ